MLCNPNAVPGTHRFAHNAMATIFEIVIQSADRRYAEQAAYAAFEELDRLEHELSRYIETSDIAKINHAKANQVIPLNLDTYDALKTCHKLYKRTHGAFDITIGHLIDCWKGKNQPPTAEKLAYAKAHSGFQHIKFHHSPPAVQLTKAPLKLDMGGFGKGYALDKMAEILREWDIKTALLHGGGSSVFAMGKPGKKGWPLSIRDPDPAQPFQKTLALHDRAMGASAQKRGCHIIDPRTGSPAEHHRAAWVLANTAAAADALSTAFMVMTRQEIQSLIASNGLQAILLQKENPDPIILGCKN